MAGLQIRERATSRQAYRFDRKEDISSPIAVLIQDDTVQPSLQRAEDVYNQFLLTERESHGRRVRIRVGLDVLARSRKGKIAFARLRNKAVTLSLPSAEQAEIAIEIIRQVCKSMAGKHLTRAPE